jgi:cytoskeletal protein RodZ
VQASDFGQHLRRAREQSGVTLRQIAESTKLSVANLTLLENNRVDKLPGGIYRRAIVRSYAAHVGLDPEATLHTFLAQHPDEVPTWDDLLPPPRTHHPVVRAFIGAATTLLPVLALVFPSRS